MELNDYFSCSLEDGLYRLNQDVENPKPDRRKQRQWNQRAVIPIGFYNVKGGNIIPADAEEGQESIHLMTPLGTAILTSKALSPVQDGSFEEFLYNEEIEQSELARVVESLVSTGVVTQEEVWNLIDSGRNSGVVTASDDSDDSQTSLGG